MFNFYDKRKIIKVLDGPVTKYLIMVLRSPENLSYTDHIWCPLTNLTENNGYIEKFLPNTQFLYTEDELKEMLKALPDEHRYNIIQPNANTKEWFEKWILDGIKSAMTVEEHIEVGNNLSLSWQTRSPNLEFDNALINSSDKLLSFDKGLRNDHPKKVTISFEYINLRAKSKESTENDYYVIKADSPFDSMFVARMGAKKIIYARMKNEIMRFPSEIKALDYCEKHKDKLRDVVYEITYIESKEHLLSVIEDYNVKIY